MAGVTLLLLASYVRWAARLKQKNIHLVKQLDEMTASSGVEVKFSAGLGAETRTSYESNGEAPEGFIVKWKGYNTDQTNYDKVGICLGNPDNFNNPVTGAENVPYRPTTSGTSSPLEADGTGLSGLVEGKTYNFYSYYPYVEDQYISYVSVKTPNLKEQIQATPGDNTHIGTMEHGRHCRRPLQKHRGKLHFQRHR